MNMIARIMYLTTAFEIDWLSGKFTLKSSLYPDLSLQCVKQKLSTYPDGMYVRVSSGLTPHTSTWEITMRIARWLLLFLTQLPS